MTDAVEIALIGAAAVVLSAAGPVITTIFVRKVERKIDGRMDELLDTTRKLAHADGVVSGRQDERDERREDQSGD
jgi:hypothetical protein